ncbi:hypothetical protein LA080_016286 [Diaporthe eres]|nr:hypothetical protein LA080_016286 [Diaporthe eres]
MEAAGLPRVLVDDSEVPAVLAGVTSTANVQVHKKIVADSIAMKGSGCSAKLKVMPQTLSFGRDQVSDRH